MIGRVLDTVLDRSIVGGYTTIGYRLRQRGWEELESMAGKVVLVTGATSGLGSAAATGFARLGATVHLLVRDPTRGEDARAAVAEQADADAEVHLELCDLARLDAVREFARDFSARVPRLDVLINNASVLTPERTLSPDGIELTFAVNVLAPFLLTAELRGVLRRSAPSRVINISSGGMYAQRLNTDDLENSRDFSPTTAYARTKRAEVVLTEMWADRLAPDGITVNAMHPGWADTPGVRSSLPRFYRLTRPLLRTPAEGADTILWLGAAPAAAHESGGFWHDRVRRPVYLLPATRESAADRRYLWVECERLSGSDPI